MKKLSSLFIALAVFCFIVLTSCQGSGSTETVEEATEAVEEAATEVMEETVDSTMVDSTEVEMEAEEPAE